LIKTYWFRDVSATPVKSPIHFIQATEK